MTLFEMSMLVGLIASAFNIALAIKDRNKHAAGGWLVAFMMFSVDVFR